MAEGHHAGKVDDINWSALGYPDMPAWLRGIASEVEQIRDQAYDILYHNNVDYLSKATTYVVPFLIELLQNESVKKKEGILLLLMQLASEATVYKIGESMTAVLTLQEIEKGVHVYLPFLEITNARFYIFHLLSCLKTQVSQIAPTLLSIIHDAGAQTRVECIQCLGDLVANNGFVDDRNYYAEFFTRLMSHEESDVVRLVAGLALIDLMKEDTPAGAEDIVIQFPRNSFPHRNLVPEALLKLGYERSIKALIQLLHTLDSQTISNLYATVALLLNLGFHKAHFVPYSVGGTRSNGVEREIHFLSPDRENPPSPVQSLTDIQKNILTSIIEKDDVWIVSSNIFALHGLPDTRDELRNLACH